MQCINICNIFKYVHLLLFFYSMYKMAHVLPLNATGVLEFKKAEDLQFRAVGYLSFI